MIENGISDDELVGLEMTVSTALKTRDLSALNILGFGEISVALGFPTENPRVACKRTPPMSPTQFTSYQAMVDRYIDELRAKGLSVIDTEVRPVQREGAVLSYLVQPLLPASTLGHNVLAAAEPSQDHKFLLALSETIRLASTKISIDAQVTNWSWDGSQLTLIDVGSPFLWDENGTFLFDMSPFLPMVPAPLRPTVRKDLTRLVGRWQTQRGVALDIVANLRRAGLDQWIEPAMAAMNRTLGADDTIVWTEAEAIFTEDRKTFPKLTKLKRLERAWQNTVRRRPYDFFIQSSFGDKTY